MEHYFFRRAAALLILLVLCSGPMALAQVAGKWYGVAVPANNAASNGYLCELVLTQKGNQVNGSFNYYFRNGYLSNSIKGTYNPQTRKLHTRELPVVYHGTKDVAIGVDCKMEGSFTLLTSKNATTLTGYFYPEEDHSLTCTPLKIKFAKQLKEDVETNEDTTAPAIKKPFTDEVKSKEEMLEDSKRAEVKQRVNEVIRELDITDDSVRIQFYDNGVVDNDSISVFYNNKLVVYRQLLSDRVPIVIKVGVNAIATNNDLIMFAENLGDTPPNSALMIISDSKHKYEVYLTSNYQKNATVRLRKEGADNRDKRE